jgi:hypothetical protein
MRKLLTRLVLPLTLSIFLSNAFGQVTLTFQNNGLLAGDSSRTHEVTYVDPGAPGENQVWDFSDLQYTGKTTYRGVAEMDINKSAGQNAKSILLTEEGYEYNYISGESVYTESGYTNPGKKMTLDYTAPVVQMKFPFSFGQQFAQPYSGIAWFNGRNRIDFSGTFTVSADACGTLILPDRVIKNVLRVKTVKQGLQIGVCGSTESTAVKYFWYAPGYRYPVLVVGTTENRYGGKPPVTIKCSWTNLNQQPNTPSASLTGLTGQPETGENSVIVFPNPFSDQVTYNYFLRKQVPAKVEMYDMSGKFNVVVEKKKVQPEGLHTGTLDAAGLNLPPGVYYLRFTFDQQVVVTKIVKI